MSHSLHLVVVNERCNTCHTWHNDPGSGKHLMMCTYLYIGVLYIILDIHLNRVLRLTKLTVVNMLSL